MYISAPSSLVDSGELWRVTSSSDDIVTWLVTSASSSVVVVYVVVVAKKGKHQDTNTIYNTRAPAAA